MKKSSTKIIALCLCALLTIGGIATTAFALNLTGSKGEEKQEAPKATNIADNAGISKDETVYVLSLIHICFISIEPKVGVNYGGTVLMKEVLDFRESGYISFEEDTDPNFTGLSMTPQEFADEELEETQKFRGMQL